MSTRRQESVRPSHAALDPPWHRTSACDVVKVPSALNCPVTGARQVIVPARGQLIVCWRSPWPFASKQIRPTFVVQSSRCLIMPDPATTVGASRPRSQQPCRTLRSLFAQRSAGKGGGGAVCESAGEGGRGGGDGEGRGFGWGGAAWGTAAVLHSSTLCLNSSFRVESWEASRVCSACNSLSDARSTGVGSGTTGGAGGVGDSAIVTVIEATPGMVRRNHDAMRSRRIKRRPKHRDAHQKTRLFRSRSTADGRCSTRLSKVVP